MIDPVELTRTLIAFDTVNPPGRERACAEHIAALLSDAGFEATFVPLGPDRASLVARKGKSRSGSKPLVFTGHIDVVPLGTRPWKGDPFSGEISNGRLYGRGASDMKSGVAAFVAAAVAECASAAPTEVVLIITAGEETGCDGAEAIVAAGLQGTAGALVVCEPTANVPYVGHKGALWLKAVLSGITAHGSMPDKGDNAVYKAARAVNRLAQFKFGCDAHPVLGKPTINIGSFHGGLNINSVPDRAEVEIDLRTIPALDHEQLRRDITTHMQEDAQIETLIDLPGIWTSPSTPWVERVGAITAQVTGKPVEVKTATYFSDASVFVPAMGGAPTLILGPGEPSQAHQTDEWCSIEAIAQATSIYREMIRDWAK